MNLKWGVGKRPISRTGHTEGGQPMPTLSKCLHSCFSLLSPPSLPSTYALHSISLKKSQHSSHSSFLRLLCHPLNTSPPRSTGGAATVALIHWGVICLVYTASTLPLTSRGWCFERNGQKNRTRTTETERTTARPGHHAVNGESVSLWMTADEWGNSDLHLQLWKELQGRRLTCCSCHKVMEISIAQCN